MQAARYDLAISLDGDALAHKVKRFDQLVKGQRRRKTAGVAIDDEFDHNFYPGMSFSMMRGFYPEAP